MRTSFLVRTAEAAVVAGLLFTTAASAGTKTTSTWAAPDIRPAAGGKVLVLARFNEDVAKRILEDSLVKGLADKGIEALAAYQTLTPDDLGSEEAIRTKARELGATAGIVFTVTGQNTQVQSGPSVHASVGVPVSAGPFSLFLGTSVPLGGGTSTVQVVGVKAEYFGAGSGDPVWIGTYSTDLKAGTEGEARAIAGLTLKQLKKAGLFRKP